MDNAFWQLPDQFPDQLPDQTGSNRAVNDERLLILENKIQTMVQLHKKEVERINSLCETTGHLTMAISSLNHKMDMIIYYLTILMAQTAQLSAQAQIDLSASQAGPT
jgi:hypothetical protein